MMSKQVELSLLLIQNNTASQLQFFKIVGQSRKALQCSTAVIYVIESWGKQDLKPACNLHNSLHNLLHIWSVLKNRKFSIFYANAPFMHQIMT